MTIQQATGSVNVAQAGATFRVGVYADANGVPGALIEEFTATTQLDASTTGDKTLAVSQRNLPTGLYWVAAVAQGTTAATVGILTGAGPYIGRTGASSATGHAMAYSCRGDWRTARYIRHPCRDQLRDYGAAAGELVKRYPLRIVGE